MTDIVIHVKDLSKKYIIGASQVRYDTMRDLLVAAFKPPFRKNKKMKAGIVGFTGY